MRITTNRDLYSRTQITQNSGLTDEQIRDWEVLALTCIFGYDQADTILTYLDTNQVCTVTPPMPTPSDNPFGGKLTDGITVCTYGILDGLINGEGAFRGLKYILCLYIEAFAASTGNLSLSRANTNFSGSQSNGDFMASLNELSRNIPALIGGSCKSMVRWLNKSGNNPMGLVVKNYAKAVPFMTNVTGQNVVQRSKNYLI